MDIWRWWFAKLVVAQILYLFVFIWGMRALKQWRISRARISQKVPRQPGPRAALDLPAPFQKP